jgi:transcriptional regulator with XRE-family HTH domain
VATLVNTLVRELAALERLHDEFGFSYGQLAQALNTNETTLHRWRAGHGGEPTPVYLKRLAAFDAFLDELDDLFDVDSARAWLDQELRALKGESPRAMILGGHIDRVTGLLYAINAGITQ